MDEVTPEMRLARRIAVAVIPDGLDPDLPLREAMREIAGQAALAAIKETTERIERLLDKCGEPCPQCRDALRNLEHLK